jgi:hypothetical protein
VTPGQNLERLQKLRWCLDEAFRVPGTSIRVGWDPIIGLVPWIGDVLTAILSCAIVAEAHRMRIPGVVQARMLLNIFIDLVVGTVPFIGDIADVFWKSNSKNLALLERHATEMRPATTGDWVFVASVVAGVIAMALVPLIVLYWIGYALAAHLPPFAR